MARIRSVHPGVFTDEAFVGVCPLARLFLIGLWTEADDNGVFSWKPLTLKMRILPGDTADAAAFLSDLEQAGIIRRFEVDGSEYGAIRNFRKFQRPEKPRTSHPLPAEIAAYVGLECTTHPGSGKALAPMGGGCVAEGSVANKELVADESPTPRGISGQIGMVIGEEDTHTSNKPDVCVSSDDEDPEPDLFEDGETEPKAKSSNGELLREAVEVWNEVAGQAGRPRVSRLTGRRSAALRVRLRDDLGNDLERWRNYVMSICASRFLRGETDSTWPGATFDWALKPDNLAKVREGQYRDRES